MNQMKLVMENWRNFNSEQLLREKKASELLSDFETAKQQLDNIKDEKKRKQFLAKMFVGVAGVGVAIYLAPVVATILSGAGIKLGVTKILWKISTSGFGQFFQSLPEPAQDALLNKLPDYKDKLKDGALKLVNKLLDIPDEQSARNSFLRKIDLPDNLDDILKDEVYDEVVTAIKQKLINLGDEDLDGTTMQLAGRLLRKKYTITIGDPRVKMSEVKKYTEEEEMNLTTEELQQIIQEELEAVIDEKASKKSRKKRRKKAKKKAAKKDACYHKVKSRYKVWPSAYASGALVKCRKVGAKNWGNKSKKNESLNESEGEFKPHMMYDPKTNKKVKANKVEDHERLAKKGYTHVDPAALRKVLKDEGGASGMDPFVKAIGKGMEDEIKKTLDAMPDVGQHKDKDYILDDEKEIDVVKEQKKNCGCGQDPCKTYGTKKIEESLNDPNLGQPFNHLKFDTLFETGFDGIFQIIEIAEASEMEMQRVYNYISKKLYNLEYEVGEVMGYFNYDYEGLYRLFANLVENFGNDFFEPRTYRVARNRFAGIKKELQLIDRDYNGNREVTDQDYSTYRQATSSPQKRAANLGEYIVDEIAEAFEHLAASTEDESTINEKKGSKRQRKKKCKKAKGKRFVKRVNGRCRSYGQAGQAKGGGDRIRPGTKKGDAYCARSAKIKKCKNPPCANDLSRKKWKCRGSKSMKE